MAEKLLLGWCMLSECCTSPGCAVPLLRDKQGRLYCVSCDSYVGPGVAESEKKEPQEPVPTETKDEKGSHVQTGSDKKEDIPEDESFSFTLISTSNAEKGTVQKKMPVTNSTSVLPDATRTSPSTIAPTSSNPISWGISSALKTLTRSGVAPVTADSGEAPKGTRNRKTQVLSQSPSPTLQMSSLSVDQASPTTAQTSPNSQEPTPVTVHPVSATASAPQAQESMKAICEEPIIAIIEDTGTLATADQKHLRVVEKTLDLMFVKLEEVRCQLSSTPVTSIADCAQQSALIREYATTIATLNSLRASMQRL